MKILSLLLAVFVFNGCATYVQTTVNAKSRDYSGTYKNFNWTGKTFDVGHPDKTINASQEFASHKARIVQKLRTNGLVLNTADPDIVITVTYGIAGGYRLPVSNKNDWDHSFGSNDPIKKEEPNAFRPKPKVETPKVEPENKVPALSKKIKTGLGALENTTYVAPVYGGVGPDSSRFNSYSEYSRRLDIEMFDGESLKSGRLNKVYDLYATSKGSADNLSHIVPFLIESAFRVFPQKNTYRSIDLGLGEVEGWRD